MGASTEVRELIDRALFASHRKEWDEALNYSEQALALDPENYLAHKRRGLALWYSDRRDEAVEAMRHSAQLRPEFESAHYNLACFYAHLQRRDDMLASLRRAIDLASEYMDIARKDSDFEDYEDDDDFIALVRPNAEVVGDLQEVFESGDLEKISDRLRRLGRDIPLAAVDWDDEGEGGNLSEVLCDHAEKIDLETLKLLYRVIALDVQHDLYDFDGWHELHRVLREKDEASLTTMLVETWKKRYAEMDAGHLGVIEHVMLNAIDELSPDVKGAVALWALRSHGPDAVRDYDSICASTLAALPEKSALAESLVEELDRAMHGSTYAEDELGRRRKRVALALPPPTLDVPSDSDDPWIYQRTAMKSFHPQHVVGAARHLSIQRDPVVRGIVEEHQQRLIDFVLDDGLSEELRVGAVSVLGKLGISSALKAIEPVLRDRSPDVLFAVGQALSTTPDLTYDATVPANSLLALLTEVDDWSDQYDVIRALRWFPTGRSTQMLCDALQQKREAIRREALYGLGYHRSPDTVGAIVQQLLEGSGQCVTAAADALSRMDLPESHAALRDEQNYRTVLEAAKKSPRWATRALIHFDVPQLSDDLFQLFCTTKEFEAVEHLAHGISLHPKEVLLPKLVEFGLDTYRMEDRSGRYLVEIGRAAVAANPEGPANDIRDEVVRLLSTAKERAITDLIEHLDRDVRYADERALDPDIARAQRIAYAERLKDALSTAGENAARLPHSLFGVAEE